MDINQIHDPYEDPADTEDTDSMPSRRKPNLRAKMIRQLFKPVTRKFIFPIPSIVPSGPGLAYLHTVESSGHRSGRETAIQWMSNKILYHPAFRYALLDSSLNHFNRHTDSRAKINIPYFKDKEDCCTVLGSVGAFVNDGCTDVNRVFQSLSDALPLDVHFLLKFHDDESYAAFKRTAYHVPFHQFISPPGYDPEALFEDDDYAQITGWRQVLGNTYSEEEIHGIAAHYKNFEKMSMIFLGDTDSLNDIYRRIGGKVDREYRVWRLREEILDRKAA